LGKFIKRHDVTICSIVHVLLRIDKGCVCWIMRISLRIFIMGISFQVNRNDMGQLVFYFGECFGCLVVGIGILCINCDVSVLFPVTP